MAVRLILLAWSAMNVVIFWGTPLAVLSAWSVGIFMALPVRRAAGAIR